MLEEVQTTTEIRVTERQVYRVARGREILCRMTDLITPYRDGLNKLFLLSIEELE